jgi:beta-glucosidase
MSTPGARSRRRTALALGLVAAALATPAATATATAERPVARGAVYRDASAPVAERVRDLLARMSLAQKVGQMGQINSQVLQGDPATPWDFGPLGEPQLADVLDRNMIGSILSGGGAWPPAGTGNDARAWAEEVNAIQRFALSAPSNTLGIPIVYGVDAVHGHNNLSDATLVPHQIGVGASFDAVLARRLGAGTARAVRATGIPWDFAPVLDTQRDHRWGRSYEPFGEDPLLAGTLGAATIRGLQGDDLASPEHVAATAKHFAGYSAPDSGMDRTDATIGETELQEIHLPPFAQGIDAGVATVMINSGSVNGEPVHASHRLLTDVLRGQLGFQGVAISDWQDVENLITKYHVAATMEDALALAVNAGMDMSMIPLDADGFTAAMLAAVRAGEIPQWRVDQAVARILALKFRLGLFERPYVDAARANAVVEDPANRVLARRAAAESLVLLGNDGTLPLSRRTGRLLVTGPSSDSAFAQTGGWTVSWQGNPASLLGAPVGVTPPRATTLRQALEASAPAGTEVVWRQGAPEADTTNRDPTAPDPNDAADAPAVVAARAEAVAAAADADAIVVAVGESPYAEGQGDDPAPALEPAQAALVDALEATGKPVVVVVLAGRPLVMNAQLDGAAASLMAFLPGSEGGPAIADALFGRVNPGGRLPVSWPRSTAQLPLAYNEPGAYDPRYAFGHGLGYTRLDARLLAAPRRVPAGARVALDVEVRNRGRRAGDDVVLAFAEGPGARRRLVAFARVRVGAGGRRRARLSFRAGTAGEYRLRVEGSSRALTVTG